MPVFNAEKYLGEAIDSILQQSFKNFELIIIDDGSTDDSLKIINEILDSRIRLIRNYENRGLVYSLNLGILESRGQFIARMDADDVSVPERFRLQIGLMHDEKLDICGSNWAQVDSTGHLFATFKAPSSYEQIVATLATTVPYAHGSIMLRKSFLSNHQLGYRDCYGEDYDLWIRFFGCGAKFGSVDETLYFHRFHKSSITSKKSVEQAKASKLLRRAFVRSNLDSCFDSLITLENVFPCLSKSIQVHSLYLAFRVFFITGKFKPFFKLFIKSSPGVFGRFLWRTFKA